MPEDFSYRWVHWACRALVDSDESQSPQSHRERIAFVRAIRERGDSTVAGGDMDFMQDCLRKNKVRRL